MKYLSLLLVGVLGFGTFTAVVGCDKDLEHEKTVDVKKDGTVVTQEKKVSEQPDGTVVKQESKDVQK